MVSESSKNQLDNFAVSRIMRRCEQLKIPFVQIVNSPYFQSRKDKIPKSKIQYTDGLKNVVGWGKSKQPIAKKDTVPFSHEEMIILLGLDESNDYLISMPGEISDPATFPEGTTKTVSIDRYERNARARKACIEH